MTKAQSYVKKFLILSTFFSCLGFSETIEEIFADLKKESIESEVKLPIIYNTNFLAGYLQMPSAMVAEECSSAIGYAYFYPYQNVGVNFQVFPFLELAFNYKIFTGKNEEQFGSYGFGDDADRMANLKFVFDPKRYFKSDFPKIAIGIDDFYGSKRFYTPYVVLTKTWPKWGVDLSLGYGLKRIKGPFFGINYSPFLNFKSPFLKSSTFTLEYDAIDYENLDKEHPKAKDVASRINFGYNLNFLNLIDFKIGTYQGNKLLFQSQLHYNFGDTQGLFPKVNDPNYYQFPKNLEPLGHLRSELEAAYQMALALLEQGFYVTTIHLITDDKNELGFQIELINLRYWRNEEVKRRIFYVIKNLFPENLSKILVTINENGLPIETYEYKKDNLEQTQTKEAVKKPTIYDAKRLFYRKKTVASWLIRPRLLSFFGSTTGKYKYALSLIGGPQGYLFDELYYKLLLSYNIKSSIQNLSDVDYYDPSQLLAVRSDSVRYFQTNTVQMEQAYLQKGWNFGKGFYFRSALGYFEPAYAGFALETLYFPVGSSFALGFEAATVLKRNYSGLGFQWKVRKLTGRTPEYVPFVGVQYFLDGYYFFNPFKLEFKLSIGQFLAKDKGVELNISKYYDSGLKVGYWMTMTNAHDTVHDKIYYNKGVYFSMPLDIFLTKSSRNYLGYGLAFWLRDSGAKAMTGKELYPTLIRARQF